MRRNAECGVRHRGNGGMHVQSGLPYALILLVLLLTPSGGMSEDTPASRYSFDPHRPVEFNFTNSDIAEVIRHVVQLTGWSVFYNPAQVHGKVTIITSGKIPLVRALRLVQGVMHSHGHAIQVLTLDSTQPVPLTTVLAELTQPRESRGVAVWRNSNARGPKSRPYACYQQNTTHPLLPYWVDVIVDTNQ